MVIKHLKYRQAEKPLEKVLSLQFEKKKIVENVDRDGKFMQNKYIFLTVWVGSCFIATVQASQASPVSPMGQSTGSVMQSEPDTASPTRTRAPLVDSSKSPKNSPDTSVELQPNEVDLHKVQKTTICDEVSNPFNKNPLLKGQRRILFHRDIVVPSSIGQLLVALSQVRSQAEQSR